MKYPTISDAVIYIGADDKTIDLFEVSIRYPMGSAIIPISFWMKRLLSWIPWTAGRQMPGLTIWKAPEAAGRLTISSSPTWSRITPPTFRLCASDSPICRWSPIPRHFLCLPQFFYHGVFQPGCGGQGGRNQSLGRHTLQFFMAPMVHWPEVMVTYEQSERFSFLPTDSASLAL